jgi:hypothetical protein
MCEKNRDIALIEVRITRTRIQRWGCTLAAVLLGVAVSQYPETATPVALALTAHVAFRRSLV